MAAPIARTMPATRAPNYANARAELRERARSIVDDVGSRQQAAIVG
jgi:hypothetical protein